jgi:uncharacterized phiE125 gp8 family phage protein
MALKIDTAPSVFPVSLTEVKEHMRITATNENDFISNLIKAATYWAESYTGMKFVDQYWIYYIDKFPSGDIIEIPFPPLLAVSYVKYYDSDDALQTLVANTNYRVDIQSIPGRIEGINAWPGTKDKVNAVEIKFQCGYSDVSDIEEDIKAAIKTRVSDLYENRQSENVSVGVPISMVSGSVTAKSLLDFYRIFNRTW